MFENISIASGAQLKHEAQVGGRLVEKKLRDPVAKISLAVAELVTRKGVPNHAVL